MAGGGSRQFFYPKTFLFFKNKIRTFQNAVRFTEIFCLRESMPFALSLPCFSSNLLSKIFFQKTIQIVKNEKESNENQHAEAQLRRASK